MVKKFLPEDDIDIIRLWYQGESRSEIEAIKSTSAGHVSDVVQNEKALIGEGNVDALRRLAIEIGKEKYNLVDIVRAIRFLNSSDEMGMDDEKVIEYLPRIKESCIKGGIELEDLPLDTESRIAKIEELDSQIESKERSLLEASKRTHDALDNAEQTEEGLAKFNGVRSMLVKRGLISEVAMEGEGSGIVVVDILEKLENALANAEAKGYDIKSIIDAISENQSLESKKADLESQNIELERTVTKNTKLIEQQKSEITKNAEALTKLREVEEMGLGLPQLEILTETVTKIAVENGLDASSSVKKFIDDIDADYASKFGFAKKLEECKKECEGLEKKIDSLKMEYAADKFAVESVRLLHSKGVKDHEIVALSSIVQRSGASSMTELDDEIKLHGSLKNANREYEKQGKELQKDVMALKAEKETLESNNAALKKARDAFLESFQKDVESFTNQAKAGGEAFNTIIKETNETAKQGKAILVGSTTEAAKQVGMVFEAADEGYKRIMKNKRLLDYEPLVLAERGEKVSKEKIVDALISAINAALPYLNGVAMSSIRTQLEIVRNKLQEALKFSLLYL